MYMNRNIDVFVSMYVHIYKQKALIDTQASIYTDNRLTSTQAGKQTVRQTVKQTDIKAGRQTVSQSVRQTDRHKSRQTDSQSVSQTDRQTSRQRDIQTD